MNCANCGHEWTCHEVFTHTPESWRLRETLASRVCQLCRMESKNIISIMHGDFQVAPTRKADWQIFLSGNFIIKSCPKCGDKDG